MAIQGCKRADPNPEMSDPIYQDLVKELAGFKSLIEDTEKKIEAAKKDLAKSAPRTMERKNAQLEIQKHEDSLSRLKEMQAYYEIRTERRRVEGRRNYKIAFEKGESWPDPKEFDAYMTNKRLVHSSKNWNNRVPKTNQNQTNYDKPKEADAGGHSEPAPSGH